MIRIGKLEEAFEVYRHIPELRPGLTLSDMAARLSAGAIILVGELNGELKGFKLGYPVNQTEFYSWLGGVIADAREHGIAQRLLEKQEQLVRQRDFKYISVKTTPRHRSMLQLLKRNGYQHIESQQSDKTAPEKMLFRKALVTAAD